MTALLTSAKRGRDARQGHSTYVVLPLLAITLSLLVVGSVAHGQTPTVPSYQETFADDTTGNNEFVSGGKSYWDIDAQPGDANAGADNYYTNTYERPTSQGFSMVAGRWAVDKYFPELDIVGGKLGKDATFLYLQVAFFGTDPSDRLSQEYNIQIDYDRDGRGDFLFVTDNPGSNNTSASFTQNALTGFEDVNGDVGGTDPNLSLSAGDGVNPGMMNGYEDALFSDANSYFWVRIHPTLDSVLEIAVNHINLGTYLGMTLNPDSVLLFCAGADKGVQDNQKYYFHDKYTIEQAGTPYNEGYPIGNIYEYDNSCTIGLMDPCDANSPPGCQVPNDTSIFQCSSTQVCLPVGCTDVDDNLASGPIITSGPGTIVGNNWCYTALADTTVCVTISCIDDCNDTCLSTFCVEFDICETPQITCPGNSQVTCSTLVPLCNPADASVSVCRGTPIVTCQRTNNNGAGCPGDPRVYTFTYIVTDSCGKADTCSRTVTVIDDVKPTLSGCPSNTNAECGQVPPPATVTASDNCDPSVNPVFSETSNLNGCGGYTGTIARKWVATDDCGNKDSCTQTITVVDTQKPTLSGCPADASAECGQVPPPAAVTAFDACDASVIPVFSESSNLNGCGGYTGTITRKWVATDDCGNKDSCMQTITVVDTQKPTLSGCPANTSAPCDAIPPPATVTASDACDSSVTPVYSEESNVVGCSGTITRKWVATDDCGNSDSCMQTISVDDNSAPTLSGCPGDTTVECGQVPPPATVTASDACDTSVTPVFSETPNLNGCGGYTGTITRKWVATDDCGNSDSCMQTITVLDTQKPTLSGCPANANAECGQVPPPATVTATDACDASVTPVFSETSNLNGCGGYTGTITRKWVATDDCGNSDSCMQTITVVDTQKPTLSGCPANTSAPCDAIPPPATVTASDACDSSVTPVYSEESNVVGCSGTITRKWVATDDCGNSDSCMQTISVDDNSAPTLSGCPGDTTVECGQVPPPATVTASDACDTSVTPVFSETPNLNGCGGYTGTITRKWVATDDCGNSDSCMQTITVLDTQKPTLSGCPANANAECGQVPPPATVTATDACDASVTPVFSETSNLNGCGGYTGTITRKWVATDDCGNSDSCMQTITVVDTQKPTLSGCPANANAECGQVPPPATVTATDACDASVTPVFSETSNLNGCGGYTGTITRKWVATDDCGNSDSCMQTITVIDSTPPEITCPAFVTLEFECRSQVPPCDASLATATDNCDQAPAKTCERSDNGGSGCAASPLIITDLYIATDACGNADSCEVQFTVIDLTAPVLSGCPANTSVTCGQIPPPATVTATDNCDPSVVPVLSEVNNVTGCSGTITRKWVATDDCGNKDSCMQTITVVDNTPPVLSGCPGNTTAQCGAVPPPATVTASDACDSSVVPVFSETQNLTGCGNYTGTITRKWVATDDCGNKDSCMQTITVVDNTPPVITSCPGNQTLGCNQPVPPCDANGPSANDNCDPAVTVTCNRTDNGGAGTLVDPLIITDLYIASDDCGNADSCTRTIVVACPPDDDTCVINLAIGDSNIHVLNGVQVSVPIIINTEVEVGGFDLLFCYDVTGLTALGVTVGEAIDEWEYFTYRLSSRGNCGTGCPTGLIRIVGIADLDNGPTNHPSEPQFSPDGVLAYLVFQVTSDRNFINQCIPVHFCWMDCTDNIVSSRSGNISYIGVDIAFDTCQSNPKGAPVPGVCVEDGLICIDEPPDDRGDLNLNGVANEIGDAVLYTNYFVYGPIVWTPPYVAVQQLASDINDDGVVLTVADLIYLIRIISGDEQPFPPGTGNGSPKLAPYANSGSATVRNENGNVTVSTNSDVEVGAVFMVFRISNSSAVQPVLLKDASGMTMRYNASGDELRVLIHPAWEGDRAVVGAGTREILAFAGMGVGTVELLELQMSDTRGALLSTYEAKTVVPTSYALLQNYPNPFNAGTVIAFELMTSSEWALNVYNIAGQQVRTYSGTDPAGTIRVTWDGLTQRGDRVASGIYFYRVTTPEWTATRKMTLIK